MGLTAQERFIDREEPRRLFLEKLTTPQAVGEYRLLTFYGVGGQGKNALLNHFRDVGVDQEKHTFSTWDKQFGEPPKHKIASVDFRDVEFQTSPAAALMELRHGFADTGIDFFHFDLAFSFYLSKSASSLDLQKEYPKLSRDDHGLIFDLISLAGVFFPVAAPPLTLLTTLGRHVSKLKPRNVAWCRSEEGQQLAHELDLLDQQALTNKLPHYLGHDLREALGKPRTPRLVIMMDTYEALWGSSVPTIELGARQVDVWIREFISACPGVLFVIFGRDQLKWDNPKSRSHRSKHDYKAMLDGNQHLLGGFSDSDAHLFLKQAGVRQEHIRNVIVNDAEGLPLYLNLQVDTYKGICDGGDEPVPTEFGGTLPEVIDCFLSHLSDHHKVALLVVGQARQLTKPVFELLKQRFFNGSPIDFNHLVRHSFVEELEESEQYSLHQLMQEHLYEYVKENSPSRFIDIHQVLFKYYDEQTTVENIKAITPLQETALVEAACHKGQFDRTGYSSWLTERAVDYRQAAKYWLLEPLFQRAVEISDQTVSDPNHAASLNNLADLLESMGHYEEAEGLYLKAIKITKQTVGELHRNYATDLNNLAHLYHSMGRLKEAEPLYWKAIEIAEQTVGKSHPIYATCLNNLAGWYKAMGMHEGAEMLYRGAIEISEQILNELLPNYAVDLDNLALLLGNMGRYEDAEPLHLKAIEIARQSVGELHPNYAVHISNFGRSLMSIGRYKEAIPPLWRALQIFKASLGEEHRHTKFALELYQSVVDAVSAERLVTSDVPKFSGRWVSTLGAEMELTVSGTGELTGFYGTGSGAREPTGKFDLKGFVSGGLIVFCIDSSKIGALASWAGKYTKDGNRDEVIHTLWHLSQDVGDADQPDNSWVEIRDGAEQFRRDAF